MMRFAVLLAAVMLTASCNSDKKEGSSNNISTSSVDLSDMNSKISYSWGVTAASYFLQIAEISLQPNQIFIDQVIDGFKSSEEGTAILTVEEAGNVAIELLEKRQGNISVEDAFAEEFCYAQGVLAHNQTKGMMAQAQVTDNIDMDVLYAGLEHQLKGQKLALDAKEIDAVMLNLKKDRLDPQTQQPEPKDYGITNSGGFENLSESDKVSYALGISGAMNIHVNMYDPMYQALLPKTDWDKIMEGIEDGFDGKNLDLIDSSFQEVVNEFTSYVSSPDKVSTELSQQFSYGFGLTVGQGSKMQADMLAIEKFSRNAFIEGAKDIIKNKSAKADLNTINQFLDSFAIQHIQKSGEAFLEKNKTKAGVVTTKTGLQYTILKQGNGARPTLNSKVRVHYHGTLVDGMVFESSVETGNPAELFVNEVMPGWVEGIQLMAVGSKFKFFIPQNMAYGPRAAGKIPPYSALIFEVELLDIIQ